MEHLRRYRLRRNEADQEVGRRPRHVVARASTPDVRSKRMSSAETAGQSNFLSPQRHGRRLWTNLLYVGLDIEVAYSMRGSSIFSLPSLQHTREEMYESDSYI